jgi:hypothetical protein
MTRKIIRGPEGKQSAIANELLDMPTSVHDGRLPANHP